MQIVKTSVYVGPNIYSKEPLIRLTVDLHRRADVPVRDFAGVLIDPLLGYVPALAKAVAENGENLIDRARNAPDCYLGELLAHVALALENQAGAPGSIAFSRPSKHPDEVEVLFGYESEEIGLQAGDVARDLILDLIAPDDDSQPRNRSTRCSTISCTSPRAGRSARRRWRWSKPPRRAASPGSG